MPAQKQAFNEMVFAMAVKGPREIGGFGYERDASASRDPTSRRSLDNSVSDADFVRKQLMRIALLTGEGRLMEAREVSADLLFDFQPLIVAHADLTARFADVLRRCGATAMSRRFLAAAFCEPVGISVPDKRMGGASELAGAAFQVQGVGNPPSRSALGAGRKMEDV